MGSGVIWLFSIYFFLFIFFFLEKKNIFGVMSGSQSFTSDEKERLSSGSDVSVLEVMDAFFYIQHK